MPGLGDSRAFGQKIAVKTWLLYGVKPRTFQMKWASDTETYQSKEAALLTQVDLLMQQGHSVSLVGSSAGASAVLNAFVDRPTIQGVVVICGKIQRPEAVRDALYGQNPAFRESMSKLNITLKRLTDEQRSRIWSIRPIVDFTVPVADMRIQGVRQGFIPTIGHAPSIGFAITLGAYNCLRFLKNVSK